MRVKIIINNLSNLPINFDYKYDLSSVLYHKLADADIHLANETHSKKGFKFYTFSNLYLLNKKYDKYGLHFEKAYFIISSPNNRFIKSFSEGLLANPGFYLNGYKGRVNVEVEQAEILQEPIITNECWFKTLSPINIRTERNGKPYDLNPTEPKFFEDMHKNLVRRYAEYYNKSPNDYFDIIDYTHFKLKQYTIPKYKESSFEIINCYVRCCMVSLKCLGSEELLKFAYDAGIGEKNAMGYGCVEIL